jgi:16S rRNA (cytidine1402-2'-O)-methyltransferase
MKSMDKGKLYLIPCTLGDNETKSVLPITISDNINSCDAFIVENLRSARRFLIKAGLTKKIDDLTFFELNKHTNTVDLPTFLDPIKKGLNIGVLSEAGAPAIADPGSDIVKIAHSQGIQVVPLVGPSSILLGLMASGFNGQNFAFNGYLPKESHQRKKQIIYFENHSFKFQQTQIFIETPFRNNHLLEDLVKSCNPNTEITIACDLTLENETIVRKKASDWRKTNIDLKKRPTVFLLHKY